MSHLKESLVLLIMQTEDDVILDLLSKGDQKSIDLLFDKYYTYPVSYTHLTLPTILLV